MDTGEERKDELCFLEILCSLSNGEFDFMKKVYYTYRGLISLFGYNERGISLYVEYPQGIENYVEDISNEFGLKRELLKKNIDYDRIGRKDDPDLWELYFEKGKVRVYMGSSHEVNDSDEEFLFD